jgi:predicted RNase H-like nuclease
MFSYVFLVSYPRIHAVDSELQKDLHLRDVAYEVNPELSFTALDDGVPVVASKRKGVYMRRSLVENYFGSGVLEEIQKNHYLKDVGNLDIIVIPVSYDCEKEHRVWNNLHKPIINSPQLNPATM